MWPFKTKPLVHKTTQWRYKYQCHCGQIYNSYMKLCYECGCEDSVIQSIGRWEWDENPNILICTRYDMYIFTPWKRENALNAIWVVKPEGCQAEKSPES